MFKKRVPSLLLAAIFSLSLAVNINAASGENSTTKAEGQAVTLDSKEKSVTEDVYSTNKSVQEDVYSTDTKVVTPQEENYTPTVIPTPVPTPVMDQIGSISNVSVELDKKELNIRTININGRYYAALADLCYYLNVDYKADVNTKIVNVLKDKKTTLKSAEKFVKKSRIDIVKVLPGQYSIKIDNIDTCLESYIYAGRSYVPVRYFTELFDRSIDYLAARNTISISKAQDQVIGTVNGVSLYKSDFDFFYNGQSKNVTESADKQNLDSELKKLKQTVFDYIVEEALIKMNMPKSQATLKESDYNEINSYINRMVEKYGGIEKLRSVLAEDKVSFNQFIEYTKSTFLGTNYLNSLVKDIKATDEQIEKYYEDNKKSFVQPEKVTAKHILFFTTDQATGENYPKEKVEEIEKKAKEVLKSIRDGADFDELMKKYGEDPGAKQMPEGYTFSKGEMVKEFEESAFAMKVGEVSDLVKTEYGYHIIKVVDKVPEKQIQLNEVKESIKPELDQKAQSDYLQGLLDKWKAASNIVNNMK